MDKTNGGRVAPSPCLTSGCAILVFAAQPNFFKQAVHVWAGGCFAERGPSNCWGLLQHLPLYMNVCACVYVWVLLSLFFSWSSDPLTYSQADPSSQTSQSVVYFPICHHAAWFFLDPHVLTRTRVHVHMHNCNKQVSLYINICICVYMY